MAYFALFCVGNKNRLPIVFFVYAIYTYPAVVKSRNQARVDPFWLEARRPETDVRSPHCGGDVVDDVTKNRKNAQRKLRPVGKACQDEDFR